MTLHTKQVEPHVVESILARVPVVVRAVHPMVAKRTPSRPSFDPAVALAEMGAGVPDASAVFQDFLAALGDGPQPLRPVSPPRACSRTLRMCPAAALPQRRGVSSLVARRCCLHREAVSEILPILGVGGRPVAQQRVVVEVRVQQADQDDATVERLRR